MAETRACVDCKQEFLVDEHGHLVVPFFEMHSSTCEDCGKPWKIEYTEDGMIDYDCPEHGGGSGSAFYGFSDKYCPRCRDERHKKNKQAYPLCPMCSTPTRVGDFLQAYQGHQFGGILNGIKVRCTMCISRFEDLSETEQLELLRRAMVKSYGETAMIYALQYDDHFPCQHIGRTKRNGKRMAEYKRDWHKEIKHDFALQELFGPLSMEYESRWMMHALKHRWPIDNFELLTGGEDGLSGQRQQARLTEAVQAFEPLTAPFEVVGPLIRENFGDAWDAEIVHWYCSQYSPHAYPSENEMVQRLVLMERLHGLRIS